MFGGRKLVNGLSDNKDFYMIRWCVKARSENYGSVRFKAFPNPHMEVIKRPVAIKEIYLESFVES